MSATSKIHYCIGSLNVGQVVSLHHRKDASPHFWPEGAKIEFLPSSGAQESACRDVTMEDWTSCFWYHRKPDSIFVE